MLEHLLVSAIGLKLTQTPLTPLTTFLGIGSCPRTLCGLKGQGLILKEALSNGCRQERA